jgi:hypothetical protein
VRILVAGSAARAVQEIGLGLLPWWRVRVVVTGFALLNLAVEPLQWVTCLVVVELAWIPIDQWKIFALMIVVTFDASILYWCMVAGLCVDSGGQLLVTVEAFFRR